MAPTAPFPSTLCAHGPAVAFEGVSKHYGSVVAIDAVSATILPGTFVAIVGSSGSGKSTLVKAVNRLVEPDAGSVRIDGQDVLEREQHELRRSIGYVFQNIGLFPHMNVAQNIGIGSRIASRKPLPDDQVAALLDLVDLPRDFATRLPEQLSGGQQQRVGVARALAGEPGLMLMDEPFGALDPVTREALGEQYRALHERLGLTTIMVTHDMAEALLFADRIWVMASGRIVADASPAEMIAGQCGPEAEALVAVPRLQADRITAMRNMQPQP
ncbi:ATP-binding cassette domain-containing protein [Blastomonas aquatica]|uniref:ABC transporter ATP-binding protein n=1 Tax=Blastomonas aquatica TaxID=1510276 RepID=A0ABQ1JCU2_9SPHN|nr:ABC transporter ATP-binding protein [Blastomonas aquatica]GGB64124.1 ABC transporter ATP-binding protein [Blastomonas aquatica]